MPNGIIAIGINVFVLIYRLPHQADLQQRQLAPLQDAQRAMRIIRANAAKWNIKTDKIGVMGISAGGHVASTLGTHLKMYLLLKIHWILSVIVPILWSCFHLL